MFIIFELLFHLVGSVNRAFWVELKSKNCNIVAEFQVSYLKASLFLHKILNKYLACVIRRMPSRSTLRNAQTSGFDRHLISLVYMNVTYECIQ